MYSFYCLSRNSVVVCVCAPEFPATLQLTHTYTRLSVQCCYCHYSHIAALLSPLKIHQYISIKTDVVLVFLLVAKSRQEEQAKLAARSL